MIKPTFASDCTMYNSVVERYIAARMKFLGYRQTSNKPNLLISYKMFSDSMKLQGYHQPELETWLKSHVETDYRPVKYAMRTGTLLIQFYDRRQNRSVWQGYATASFGNIDYNSKTDLRNAVISILDKYRVWAEGFLENREPTEAINNP